MAASERDGMSEATEQQGAGDGSDLMDALSTGDETTFVSGEERKPVNRTSLLLFGVLLVGAAGYYFMYAKTGPASAGAAEVSAEVAQADQTIKQFLSAGEENIKVMRQLRQTTDKVVAQFRNTEVAQVPVDDLQTNPFKFSQLTDAASAAEAAAKKREEERQAVLANVRQLRLQSILHGAKPTCMVNNQMYRQGDTVSGFVIEKIESDSVVVQANGFRFKLQMQR